MDITFLKTMLLINAFAIIGYNYIVCALKKIAIHVVLLQHFSIYYKQKI